MLCRLGFLDTLELDSLPDGSGELTQEDQEVDQKTQLFPLLSYGVVGLRNRPWSTFSFFSHSRYFFHFLFGCIQFSGHLGEL